MRYQIRQRIFSIGDSYQQWLMSLTATYDISRAGAVALTVHQKAFSWTPHFDIDGPGGSYTMDGDWMDWNFRIKTGGQTVARIGTQAAWLRDSYVVGVADGTDVPTLLCLAIVMDEVAHPDHRD